MKNIHLISTDKYSPLVYSTNKYGGLFLSKYYSPTKDMGDSYQNINITSDEKIKKGDCVINLLSKEVYFITIVNEVVDYEKKIILTTDVDLIKNGVQAIDDEFLEWFVKNQICEEVEVQCRYNFYVGQDLTHYKIIIPKEENKFMLKGGSNAVFPSSTTITFNSKQETLEEIMKNIHKIKNNIYITSNEQIKDVRPHKGKWQLEKGLILNKFPTYLTDLSECKLIILTTDKDLIKVGVQAIDNEFLEWFVNNPSCEEVEVNYQTIGLKNGVWQYHYQIIIPKEEQKQHLIDMMKGDEELGLYEEPKQEIVKDLAYWKANAEEDYMKVPISVLRYISELENQMCGDEEVFNLCRAFATFVAHKDPSYKKQQEWFEQFKKK